MSRSRSPTTWPRARPCSAPPGIPTRSWPSAPSNAPRRISRRPSRSSVRASSARSSGCRPGTSRTSAPWDWAITPTARRPRTSTTSDGSARHRCGRSTPIGSICSSDGSSTMPAGMMSDWGVHLNDIVLWALDAKGPKSVYTTGGIFTSDDNRDTPDTMQVVYEFPECTLTYSMRKGNGLKYNGHDYGILFCGTDGSLMLDRGGFEVIPDKVVLPLRHQAGPRRSPAAEDRPQGGEGQGRRRPGPPRPQLPRLRQVARLPTCDIEIGTPFHQHLPSRQPLLQARAEARVGCRHRDLQERPGGQRPLEARASQGLRASRHLSQAIRWAGIRRPRRRPIRRSP